MAASKDAGTAQTAAQLVGHSYTYANVNDDDGKEVQCVIEIVDSRATDEIQIKWVEGKSTHYLDFRLGDLRRAVKEFMKS